jgi:hypothetical protein
MNVCDWLNIREKTVCHGLNIREKNVCDGLNIRVINVCDGLNIRERNVCESADVTLTCNHDFILPKPAFHCCRFAIHSIGLRLYRFWHKSVTYCSTLRIWYYAFKQEIMWSCFLSQLWRGLLHVLQSVCFGTYYSFVNEFKSSVIMVSGYGCLISVFINVFRN